MKICPNRIHVSLFSELLPAAKLESLAVKYELDSANSIKLSGPLVFCTILHGLLYYSEVSLRLLCAKFVQYTEVPLDHSTLGKRLSSISPEYFEKIFDHLAGILKGKINPKSPGPLGVHKVDATIVTISAKIVSFGLQLRMDTSSKGRKLVKSV